MARAYVLIAVTNAKTEQILREIRRLPKGVVSADMIMGPYDIIALVQANSVDEIGQVVINEIHKIDGVERTLTCMVIGQESSASI